MCLVPVHVWFLIDVKNRTVLCTRWVTVQEARRATKNVLRKLKGCGIKAMVSGYGVEPQRGMYEVEVVILSDHDAGDVVNALNPPALIGG